MSNRVEGEKWLSNKIVEWHESANASAPTTTAFELGPEGIQLQIELLHELQFKDYLPDARGMPFYSRLRLWLENVDNETQRKTMLRLLTDMVFLGRKELDCLLQTAFIECVVPWLSEVRSINIFASDATDRLESAQNETWFLPLTDSMPIADFCHINAIKGQKFRPDLRTLSKFGDESKIKKHFENSKFQQTVILEDFVGTGKQMEDCSQVIDFLSSLGDVLFIPLVICRSGLDRAEALKVRTAPVVVLQANRCVPEAQNANEYKYAPALRTMSIANRLRIRDPIFGYGNMGTLFVARSNCPDNSLGLIHRRTEHWNPIFTRVGRE